MAHADHIERDGTAVAAGFSLAALILFGVRFVQGFIFWGGASRRLIYDFHDVAGVDHAVKLDFDAPGYVAAKLTHALPGALWVQKPDRVDAEPSRLDRHFGLAVDPRRTRGRPRLDVRPRDAPIGLRQHLAQRSLDGDLRLDGLDLPRRVDDGRVGRRHELGSFPRRRGPLVARSALHRADILAQRTAPGRRGCSAVRFPTQRVRRLAIWLGLGCAAFTVLTYHVLFGAVVSPLHSRTNFHRHHIAMSAPHFAADGSVAFDAYVDAGPDTGAAYIIAATLLDGSGREAREVGWRRPRRAGARRLSQRLCLRVGIAVQARA